MNISDLLRGYTKEEVLELAAELELDITETMPSKVIVNHILEDLESNGLPTDDDITDLMEDFLIDAGILSEDGEELEWTLPKDQPVSIPVQVVQQAETPSIDVTRVPCYGFADQRAPECNRCTLFKSCMELRLVFRAQMTCFGKLYDSNDPQCRTCLESGPCRIATAEQV